MKPPNPPKLRNGDRFRVLMFVIALVVCDGLIMTAVSHGGKPQLKVAASGRTFSPGELSEYDGVDPNKPVLLAMDGNVYDVSSGRERFYAPGKPYHSLAGTDDSVLLHIAGGDIVKRKYPVVGRMVP